VACEETENVKQTGKVKKFIVVSQPFLIVAEFDNLACYHIIHNFSYTIMYICWQTRENIAVFVHIRTVLFGKIFWKFPHFFCFKTSLSSSSSSSVLMTLFQANQSQLVPHWFSSSSCSRRDPLGICGVRFFYRLQVGYASCHPTLSQTSVLSKWLNGFGCFSA